MSSRKRHCGGGQAEAPAAGPRANAGELLCRDYQGRAPAAGEHVQPATVRAADCLAEEVEPEYDVDEEAREGYDLEAALEELLEQTAHAVPPVSRHSGGRPYDSATTVARVRDWSGVAGQGPRAGSALLRHPEGSDVAPGSSAESSSSSESGPSGCTSDEDGDDTAVLDIVREGPWTKVPVFGPTDARVGWIVHNRQARQLDAQCCQPRHDGKCYIHRQPHGQEGLAGGRAHVAGKWPGSGREVAGKWPGGVSRAVRIHRDTLPGTLPTFSVP